MRLPEEANRWKSDGRSINLDLNDPSIRRVAPFERLDGIDTAQRPDADRGSECGAGRVCS